jgi:hypothetical protein
MTAAAAGLVDFPSEHISLNTGNLGVQVDGLRRHSLRMQGVRDIPGVVFMSTAMAVCPTITSTCLTRPPA